MRKAIVIFMVLLCTIQVFSANSALEFSKGKQIVRSQVCYTSLSNEASRLMQREHKTSLHQLIYEHQYTFDMMMFTTCSAGQTGGKVWQDFDNDGVKDAGETLGVMGVTVTAFDTSGMVVATTVTDANGEYTFGVLTPAPSLTRPIRVEFSAWPVTYVSTFNGSDGRTDVQFITGAECNVDLGLVNPLDFCQPNPKITVSCYVNGTNNTTSPRDAIVGYDYNATGTLGATMVTYAYKDQVGSVWGMAYSKKRKRIYASAFLKRNVGLGSAGLGGIYVVNPTIAANGAVFDTIPNAGTIGNNATRGLGAPGALSRDSAAFRLTGRIGLGDMDISPDENTLYVVNLNDKKIYLVDIDNPGAAPSSVAIPDPGCTNGFSRPFGLKVYNGKLYVGVVCDGSGVSGTRSDINATVYKMDLLTNTFDAGTVLQFPLNYLRTAAWPEPFYAGANVIAGGESFVTHTTKWYPWEDTFNPLTYNRGQNSAPRYTFCHPMPMFTDIEFDDQGNMILGFSDLLAHQLFSENQLPFASGSDYLLTIVSGGDILKANLVAGNYQIEPLSTSTANEFFGGEFIGTGHLETAQGGLILIRGKNEVITTALDPINFNTGGTIKLSVSTGNQTGTGIRYLEGRLVMQ